MNESENPGSRLRAAIEKEKPLQMVGAINAYCALLAQHAGFKALYLSGAGVANASYGLPDLGMTTRDNVVEDIQRITSICSLPLLVDGDTGFDDPADTVKQFIQAGAAGLHIEDQIQEKRCGHRPNKQVIPLDEMTDKIRLAVEASGDTGFVIMARTDAIAVEGFEKSQERIDAYIKAGAQMIFPEAMSQLEDYKRIVGSVDVPVLANITEFGKTPLFNADELAQVGVAIALYPLTAFRMMSAIAFEAYSTLRQEGSQASFVDRMQTREELYQHLDYYRYEQELDERLKR